MYRTHTLGENMLVNTFLATLAAKIAMATGLVVAGAATAGAAGVLPDPAQHAVASVVEATTPFSIADPGGGAPQVAGVDDLVTTTTSSTVVDDDDDAGEDGDGTTPTTRKENHGLCVSTVAKNTPGGPDKGKTVSSVAKSDCGKTSTSTTVPGSSTTSSTTVTTVVSSTTTSSTVAGLQSTNSGPGSANSGKGNSGKGNSGKN
jgi:hypothetical protein